MEINLYNSSAEKNRLRKSPYLQGIIKMEGILREETTISNPTITIELDVLNLKQLILKEIYVVKDDGNKVLDNSNDGVFYDIVSKILTSNYCYIPDFQRYYFINDIELVNKNIWRLTMEIDVLMSFYEDILKQECFIERNENRYNSYIYDDQLALTQEYDIRYTTIDNDLFYKDNPQDGDFFVLTLVSQD